MNAIDFLFLLGLLVALTAMLVFSKVIRAIAWESLRHPFTPSRIEMKGDKVEVHRLGQRKVQGSKPYDSSAGAR